MEKKVLRSAKEIIVLTNSNINERDLIRIIEKRFANSLPSSASLPPS
jgi:hypothetical protein